MATNMPAVRPGEAAVSSSSRARRRGRRTSGVWGFYELSRAAAGTGGQDRATCPTCFRELSAPGSNGTSHLRRHRCYMEWLAAAPEPLLIPPPAAAPPAAPVPPVVIADDDQDMTIYDGLDALIAMDDLLRI